MVIKTVSTMGMIFMYLVLLHSGVKCDEFKNKYFKTTNQNACSDTKSKFLTLYDKSLSDCAVECDVRKKCQAFNYKRKQQMCELHSDGTFTKTLEQTGPCVYVHRNDIYTQTLTDVCGNECSNVEVCDRNSKKCTVKECQPLLVENGAIFGNMLKIGSKLKIICHDGYVSVGGDRYTTCSSNEEWEPNIVCAKHCPTLSAPTNGLVSAPNTYEGETTTYTCDPGYGLDGSSTRTCGAGVWSGTAPTCVQDCPTLSAPTNGLVSAPNTYDGETATYTCDPGYGLDGSSTRTCGSGVWSGTAPTCVQAPSFTCPPDDTIYRTILLEDSLLFTYRVYQTSFVTQANALSKCLNEGAHLVRLTSSAKFNVLRQMFRTCPGYTGKKVWVDLNNQNAADYSDVNQWVSSSGIPLPSVNDFWYSSQPNSPTKLHCGGMTYLYDMKLNDKNCAATWNYICEMDSPVQ